MSFHSVRKRTALKTPFWNRFLALSGLSVLAGLALSPAAIAAGATVSINLSDQKAAMPSQGRGINTAVYDNVLLRPTVAQRIRENGIQVVRFPGGSYGDAFHWKTTSAVGAYVNANNTFDNFMTQVVGPAGAKALITANYGSGTPAEAADWVAYSKAKGYGIKYWEIGNELNGNGYYGNPGWETDNHYPYDGNRKGQAALSPAAYGRNATTFINAMKAKDSSIKCGVNISEPGFSPDTATPSYNSEVLRNCASVVDFVVIHWYPGGVESSLLSKPDRIANSVSLLRKQLTQYIGSRAGQIEVLITETNSGTVRGAPAALFMADNFLTWFENGASNVTLQELHPDFLTNNVAGLANDSPTASFYGTRMAANLADVGDRFVGAASNNALMRAHAVRKVNGSLSVMLINRDPNNSFTTQVNVSGMSLSGSGTRTDFGRGNFSGETPTSGPTKTTLSGIGSGSFSVTVAPYSMTVVTVAAGSGAPSGGTLASGVYTIFNRNSGKALDAKGWGSADGTNVQQSTATGYANQQWRLTNLGGGQVSILNVNAGKALNVAGTGNSSGDNVDLQTYSAVGAQKWTLTALGGGYYRLTPGSATATGLDVTGASLVDGANVGIWGYSGGTNQQWRFTLVPSSNGS